MRHDDVSWNNWTFEYNLITSYPSAEERYFSLSWKKLHVENGIPRSVGCRTNNRFRMNVSGNRIWWNLWRTSMGMRSERFSSTSEYILMIGCWTLIIENVLCFLLIFFFFHKTYKKLYTLRKERQLRNLIHWVLGVDVFFVINSRFPIKGRREVGIRICLVSYWKKFFFLEDSHVSHRFSTGFQFDSTIAVNIRGIAIAVPFN